MEAFLNSKGKRLMSWDEIVEGGLSKDATTLRWRHEATKKQIEILNINSCPHG
jgi:hexosaminidase